MTDPAKTVLLLASSAAARFYDVRGLPVLASLPCRVVVITQRLNAPAFAQMPDVLAMEPVSWRDEAAAFDLACRVGRSFAVDAVVTMDEPLVELCARVRQELHLRGLRPAQAARFRNKLLMKDLLSSADIRVPEYTPCTDAARVEELLALHGKLVVKPVDSFGSLGVRSIRSLEELHRWHAETADIGRFEAEEFIQGTLFHVNAFMSQSRPLKVLSAAYTPGCADIDFVRGTPLMSRFLSPCDDLNERLAAFSSQVIKTLGLADGVTHMECFVKPDGEIVFCEIAARSAGGIVPWMIEARTGLHPYKAAILIEAGFVPAFGERGDEGGGMVGGIGLRSKFESGIVGRVPRGDEFGRPWILRLEVFRQAKDLLTGASYSTDFVAQAVLLARDEGEFLERSVELERWFDESFSVAVL